MARSMTRWIVVANEQQMLLIHIQCRWNVTLSPTSPFSGFCVQRWLHAFPVRVACSTLKQTCVSVFFLAGPFAATCGTRPANVVIQKNAWLADVICAGKMSLIFRFLTVFA
ncbi:unnamed protein product [Ixodes pacificus]